MFRIVYSLLIVFCLCFIALADYTDYDFGYGEGLTLYPETNIVADGFIKAKYVSIFHTFSFVPDPTQFRHNAIIGTTTCTYQNVLGLTWERIITGESIYTRLDSVEDASRTFSSSGIVDITDTGSNINIHVTNPTPWNVTAGYNIQIATTVNSVTISLFTPTPTPTHTNTPTVTPTPTFTPTFTPVPTVKITGSGFATVTPISGGYNINSSTDVGTGYFIDTNSFFNIDNLNSAYEHIANIHLDTYEPTGFKDRLSSLFISGATVTISGEHIIYIKGRKYTKQTASIAVAQTNGIHFVYYNENGVLSTGSFPGFNVPLIASVFWNTTKNAGLLGDERHGIQMDGSTHHWMHDTVGTRYESGLTGTFTNNTISITQGIIVDEDMDHTIPLSTTVNVMYRNGTSDYIWDGTTALYYKTSGSNLLYNLNGLTPTAAGQSKYVAYWIFATIDPANPLVSIMGQREDNDLPGAQTNNKYESLSLGSLPYAEMKVLYRVILRNMQTGVTFIEAQDLRSVSNLPAGTYVASRHSLLTDLGWELSGHNDQYFNVVSGIANIANASAAVATINNATITNRLYLDTLTWHKTYTALPLATLYAHGAIIATTTATYQNVLGLTWERILTGESIPDRITVLENKVISIIDDQGNSQGLENLRIIGKGNIRSSWVPDVTNTLQLEVYPSHFDSLTDTIDYTLPIGHRFTYVYKGTTATGSDNFSFEFPRWDHPDSPYYKCKVLDVELVIQNGHFEDFAVLSQGRAYQTNSGVRLNLPAGITWTADRNVTARVILEVINELYFHSNDGGLALPINTELERFGDLEDTGL